MVLSPGTRLGSYEILSALGAGGMGEVYRARDTALGRDVAIKILPDTFAHDPERLARFEREARTLAALNHPHIAHVDGFERSGGVHALVMELVEGSTLADRIAQGPVPLDEALHIARQIAEALEAAHEAGIIHRDLKPANIKVRPDGTVKVLDFGLAKAQEPAAAVSSSASQSPTITTPAMTQAGIILGTAAYMSPEQAKGKPADKRSDVWGFGCVLYEMLTGKRAFDGEDISDTLAAILRGEPDLGALPKTTPPSIRELIGRCLTKDPRSRLQAVGEARIVIERAIAQPGAETAGAPSAVRRLVPWIVAAIFAIGLGVALVVWAPWRSESPAPAPVRLRAELGADAVIPANLGPTGGALALSPDGATLAFVGERAGVVQLYVRPLAQLQATPLSGTTNARDPFFSHDSQWVGFFADRKLKRVAVAGGAVHTLADASAGLGGAWGEDGNIVFNAGSPENLQRVSSSGGKPESLTTLGEGEFIHRWPQMLPGARAVLYTAGERGTRSAEQGVIRIQALPSGAPKTVVRGGYHARYLSSGHLVYIQEGTLFAAPFDLDRLELTGNAVPVLEGLSVDSGLGRAHYAVSTTGTVVYLSGQSQRPASPVFWMDKNGKTSPLRPMAAEWNRPRFAPDGARLAMEIDDGRQRDLWVYEWAREILTPLTRTPADDTAPTWTPDGQRIAFASGPAESAIFNLFWRRADGAGDAERLIESKNSQTPGSWHVSGRYLAFSETTPETGVDLMILPMDGDEQSGWKPGTPSVFLRTPFGEQGPIFSPDGKWIAYESNESQRNDVYVRPFPGPGGRTLISAAGGATPTWSPRAAGVVLSESGEPDHGGVVYDRG